MLTRLCTVQALAGAPPKIGLSARLHTPLLTPLFTGSSGRAAKDRPLALRSHEACLPQIINHPPLRRRLERPPGTTPTLYRLPNTAPHTPRATRTPPHPQHLTKLEKDGAAEPYRLLPFNLSIFGFPLHSLLFTRWYPTCSAE